MFGYPPLIERQFKVIGQYARELFNRRQRRPTYKAQGAVSEANGTLGYHFLRIAVAESDEQIVALLQKATHPALPRLYKFVAFGDAP